MCIERKRIEPIQQLIVHSAGQCHLSIEIVPLSLLTRKTIKQLVAGAYVKADDRCRMVNGEVRDTPEVQE